MDGKKLTCSGDVLASASLGEEGAGRGEVAVSITLGGGPNTVIARNMFIESVLCFYLIASNKRNMQ
jgi:hypothetical protein